VPVPFFNTLAPLKPNMEHRGPIAGLPRQRPLATSYDDIPYPRLAFPLTHPSHLATIGRLLGMRPAEIATCRVLELGCAGGGNLVPMAYTLPGATWVGIDLSERQIDAARAFAAALGLTNITFEPLDIAEAAATLRPRFGEFDFIIAHGVYSWVPDSVKAALLGTCRDLLAPEGIAYVSYNCYPGCQPREMLRRMCQYHGRAVTEPRAYAAQTRKFLDFLVRALPADGDVYRAALREQAAGLAAESDEVLLHDDLERDNDPCYFHEFISRAASHGLQYLGDAHFGQMFGVGIATDALERIRAAGDVLVTEQYLDFLYGRSLRTTLLCRSDRQVVRQIDPAAVRDLRIASAAVAVSATASSAGEPLAPNSILLGSDEPTVFRAPGCTLSVSDRVNKAVLLELGAAYPLPLSFAELVSRTSRRLQQPATGQIAACGPFDAKTVADKFAAVAVEWFAMRLIDLHAFAPPISLALGERPLASAVARHQLAHGGATGLTLSIGRLEEVEIHAANRPNKDVHPVTNLLHRRVCLGGELAGLVLSRLDGQHDRAAIVAELAKPVLEGRATIRIDDAAVTDPQLVERLLTERVEACLTDFARNALLVADALQEVPKASLPQAPTFLGGAP
jgi:SAM-dependent methyltransferase